MNLRKKGLLWAGAIICLAAPAWVPLLQLASRGFFLPDMVLSLGLSLMTALILCEIIPDVLVNAAERVWQRASSSRFFLFTLLASILGVLIWVNQNILHQFFNSADEHSCYFFAELIRMGKWWVKPHELSEFFNVVHVGNRDGKWFSVYPPGWPLLWALGIEIGIPHWMNPLLTVGSLPLLYLSARRFMGAQAALGGLILISVTPFFLFTGASYFSHATCLFSMSVFLYAFLRWQEARTEKNQISWACLCAIACGYGLMTRYLTMAAFALPFLVWHYLPLFLRKRSWKKADLTVVGVLALFMVIILYQNYAITGKPFKAPNKYDKSWERLFFKGEYSMLEGLLFILIRFTYMMDYSCPILAALFLVGIVRRPPAEPALHRIFRYSFFYGSLIYFLYYSWGGNQYGPRYWWESYPFLGLILAEQISRWWKKGDKVLRKFLLGVLIVSVPATGYALYKHGTFLEIQSRERKALYVLAEEMLKTPAVVFIHGFLGDLMVMAEEDAVRNSPRLDGRILYAHDLGERNVELMRAFPGREYYRGTYDRKQKKAVLENIQGVSLDE